MVLNNYSYCHVKIRLALLKLEEHTNMKVITDLSKEFNIIILKNEYSYIKIDWENQECLVMSHKLTKAERYIIDDIVCNLQWLDLKKVIAEIQKRPYIKESKSKKKGGKK